jgi:IclR family transcriptional regulator, pca regulon regulatory protein
MNDVTEVKDSEIVQTLAKGLTLIAAFGPDTQTMTIADAARLTGFSRAGARRILRTLEAMGYASQENGRFNLTPKILTLGFSFLRSSEIGDRVNPILRKASNAMRETCSLGLPSGTDMVYVAHAICEDRLFSTRFTIGARLPMAATAIGRAYLAHVSETERDRLMAQIAPRSETPNTVIDRGALKVILDRTRKQGYAATDEEFEMGALSVAVPVLGVSGTAVGALNVVVNKGRVAVKDMIEEFTPTLKEAAHDVGLALG